MNQRVVVLGWMAMLFLVVAGALGYPGAAHAESYPIFDAPFDAAPFDTGPGMDAPPDDTGEAAVDSGVIAMDAAPGRADAGMDAGTAPAASGCNATGSAHMSWVALLVLGFVARRR